MRSSNILAAANAASTVTTLGCGLGDLTQYSFHVWFSSATLAGALKLQASNNNTDWIDVKNGSQAIAAGESHIWNVTAASYLWTRFVWTPSGGTGTISAIFVAKEPANRY